MHVVQPKQEKRLVVTIEPWKVRRGHLNMSRGGKHRDRRRQARVNDRAEVCRARSEC
jgi:hypothetical protein